MRKEKTKLHEILAMHPAIRRYWDRRNFSLVLGDFPSSHAEIVKTAKGKMNKAKKPRKVNKLKVKILKIVDELEQKERYDNASLGLSLLCFIFKIDTEEMLKKSGFYPFGEKIGIGYFNFRRFQKVWTDKKEEAQGAKENIAFWENYFSLMRIVEQKVKELNPQRVK